MIMGFNIRVIGSAVVALALCLRIGPVQARADQLINSQFQSASQSVPAYNGGTIIGVDGDYTGGDSNAFGGERNLSITMANKTKKTGHASLTNSGGDNIQFSANNIDEPAYLVNGTRDID